MRRGPASPPCRSSTTHGWSRSAAGAAWRPGASCGVSSTPRPCTPGSPADGARLRSARSAPPRPADPLTHPAPANPATPTSAAAATQQKKLTPVPITTPPPDRLELRGSAGSDRALLDSSPPVVSVLRRATLRASVRDDGQLVRNHRWVGQRPVESSSVRPGGRGAGVDAFHDELALILGERGEHVQHQPARRRRRIEAIRDRLHPARGGADGARSATDPTGPPARRRPCPLLRVGEQLFHPRPLDRAPAPRSDVGEYVPFLHPRSDQRIELQLRILTRRTHPRITQEPHKDSLPRKDRRPIHPETKRAETTR